MGPFPRRWRQVPGVWEVPQLPPLGVVDPGLEAEPWEQDSLCGSFRNSLSIGDLRREGSASSQPSGWARMRRAHLSQVLSKKLVLGFSAPLELLLHWV